MTRFAYYQRLSARQKAIYRRSDDIVDCHIPDTESLIPVLLDLRAALDAANRVRVSKVCNELSARLSAQFGVSAAKVKVLSKRPSDDESELHGLYDPETVLITVWMKTAQRKQVVAFKTFLRTLLHEVCHHFDYCLYKLEDSFHTEGFYKRESAIYTQLRDAFEGRDEKEDETVTEEPRQLTLI